MSASKREIECFLATSLLIQLPAIVGLGKALENGPSSWPPATYMGESDEIPGCWLWPWSAPDHCGHMGSKPTDLKPSFFGKGKNFLSASLLVTFTKGEYFKRGTGQLSQILLPGHFWLCFAWSTRVYSLFHSVSFCHHPNWICIYSISFVYGSE